MNTQLLPILLLGSFALSSTNGFNQVSKAPAAPAAPATLPAPAALAPATPEPPGAVEEISESVSAIAEDAQNMARDAMEQAREGLSQRLVTLGSGNNSSSRSIIIPKDEADVKSLADTEQDLSIMAHILDKVASDPDAKKPHAMGISVHSPFDSNTPRNLYIDGYGAIFFLHVKYPLSAPPPAGEPAETKNEPPSEWDEARRELYQPPKPTFEFNSAGFDYNYTMPDVFSSSSPAEEYDADKVAQLQKSLIATLKNATHIRSLKPHETVTLVVSGRGPGANKRVAVRQRRGGSGGGGGSAGSGSSSSFGSSSSSGRSGSSHGGGASAGVIMTNATSPESRGNQMILRAAKSDIEAFQSDKLSYDEFRKKVTVLIY